MDEAKRWLLEAEPWAAYAAQTQLLNENAEASETQGLYEACAGHPRIAGLLDELAGWETDIVSSHKNAGLLLHKLAFLSDIGLSVQTPQIAQAVETILGHTDQSGVPFVRMNIPERFGGTGEDAWAWALCDAPVVLCSLLKLGVPERRLESAIAVLTALARTNGFPCAVSPELGRLRGPGKKDDPCPYATLQMLNLLQQCETRRGGPEARAAAESLLSLWEHSRKKHPYIFYMGTDFRKLKAPLVWYDVVSVADALSKCPWVFDDGRFLEMLGCIAQKADGHGRFTPESVYRAMKDWDFGRKKAPSAWLTLCVHRIFHRTGRPVPVGGQTTP